MSKQNKGNQLVEIKANQTGYGLLIERDGFLYDDNEQIAQIKNDISNGHKFVMPDDFIVSAVFQKHSLKNANGRIYPKDILEREVERYMRDIVLQNKAIGALDHPTSSDLSGHDVSHRITDLSWQGKTLIGKMKLHLSKPFKESGQIYTSGDKVANLLLDDILIGVSSRGLGGVEERYGALYVDDSYEIICWDVVCTPSTPMAYIKSNQQELTPFIENKNLVGKENLSEKLNKINKIMLW